jgi:hypothetical protein
MPDRLSDSFAEKHSSGVVFEPQRQTFRENTNFDIFHFFA